MLCLLGGSLMERVLPSVIELLGDGTFDWNGLIQLSISGVSNIVDCLLSKPGSNAAVTTLTENLIDMVEQILKVACVFVVAF